MENHIEVETSQKRDKGFTLVELLIVIVILGILATVTVFAVRGITDKGTVSACQADKKTLEVAVEAWYALPTVVEVNGTWIFKDTVTTGAVDSDGVITTVSTGGDNIPSEAELVTTKLIRAESSKYDVDTATATAGDLIVEDPTCTL